MADKGIDLKRSNLWLHFSPIGGGKARCDVCQKLLSYKGGTTSNLKKHLQAKHPSIILEENAYKRHMKERASVTNALAAISSSANASSSDFFGDHTMFDISVVSDPSISNMVNKTVRRGPSPKKLTPTPRQTPKPAASTRGLPKDVLRQKRLNNFVVKMIAMDLQPFSIVDEPGFREFVTALDPSSHLPNQTTLTRQLLPDIYQSAIVDVKANLAKAEYVTLTTDAWTTMSHEGYITVTAHYISDTWETCSCLLECFNYGDRDTPDHLANQLKRIVAAWKITEKLYTIVTDDTPNILAAVRFTGWMHVPCFAHSINIIVQNGIKSIKPIQMKVQTIVDHFHRSAAAAEKLRSIQMQIDAMPLNLKNDDDMLWNSTYQMFQRICQIQQPVEAALEVLHNPVETLSAEEWILLREICTVLKPFEQITVEMSIEKNVPLSKVIVMVGVLMNALNRLRPALTKEISANLLEELMASLAARFHQVEYHPVCSRATFLDPRFTKYGFNDLAAVARVKDCVASDISKIVDNQNRQGDPSTAGEVDHAGHSEYDVVSIWEEFDRQSRSVKSTPMSAASVELREYSEEANIGRNEDPLAWWKSRERLYPTLAKLAKKSLGVVATSVPSERVFSKTGQLMCERRSRLEPNNVDKLIFLNANHIVIK